MAKSIFNRIWRTFMIVVNTIWNLISVAFVISMLCNYSITDCVYNMDRWAYGVIIILFMNLINFMSRKHFTNY